jgi:hypothetical protein
MYVSKIMEVCVPGKLCASIAFFFERCEYRTRFKKGLFVSSTLTAARRFQEKNGR